MLGVSWARPSKGDPELVYRRTSTTPWRWIHELASEPGVLRELFLCTDLPDDVVGYRMNRSGIDAAMADAVASGALVGAAAAVWSPTGSYDSVAGRPMSDARSLTTRCSSLPR